MAFNTVLGQIARTQAPDVLGSLQQGSQLFSGIAQGQQQREQQAQQQELTALTGQVQQGRISGEAVNRDALARIGALDPQVKAQFAESFNIPSGEDARLMGLVQDIRTANRLASIDPDAAFRFVAQRRDELQAFGVPTDKIDNLLAEFEREPEIAISNLQAMDEIFESRGLLPTAEEKLIDPKQLTEGGQALFRTAGGGIEAREVAGLRQPEPEAKKVKADFTLAPGQIRFDASGNPIAKGAVPPETKRAPLKPTEQQISTAGFANRMLNSNQIMAGIAGAGFNPASFVEAARGKTNVTATPEFRQFEQAKSDFITAILRKESGAVISDQEFAREDKKFFPQPGDDEKTTIQKRKARERATNNLIKQSKGQFEELFGAQVGQPAEVAAPRQAAVPTAGPVQSIGRFQVRAR